MGTTVGAAQRRVFVSYSHHDRAWRDAFREMLGPALARYGVAFWADDHILCGDRWERTIDDALDSADLALLLVTPSYLRSSFSWEVEIPHLVQRGVPIVWALVEDCLWDDVAVLREHQCLQDAGRDGPLANRVDRKAELARICRRLRDERFVVPEAPAPSPAPPAPADGSTPVGTMLSPGRRAQVFGAVPARPSTFVTRADDLDGLRTALTAGLASSVGIVGTPSALGLQGRGGIGKTVLASELTRDPATLTYFPDGIFWITLGQRPDVVGSQRQLAGWLGGDPGAIRSPLQGVKVLRDLAAERQCLVVIDDVWSLGAAQGFQVTGRRGRLLVTTRDPVLLDRLGATTVALDVLSPAAARELLARLASLSVTSLPPESDTVLAATGRVALAVALVGAAIGRGQQSWPAVAARLARAGEVFAGHPYADTFKALEVATASLGDDELARYQALACFPEDTVIPPVTVGRLWGLGETDTAAQLRRFDELKLARLEAGGLVFHDLERDYLLLGAEATALAHDQLLDAYRTGTSGDWHRLDPAEPYLWDHLAYHLAAAGRHHELVATVCGPAWLAARIAQGGTLAAEADLGEALRWEPGQPLPLALLRRLRQVSHLLERAVETGAVAATLATHLWPVRRAVDLRRLDGGEAGHQPVVAWIADTTSPDLIRTLAGHTAAVESVAWSPDGTRLASGADDDTVRVWDAATGEELRTLAGHTKAVESVVWSPDGTRLASGAYDNTVRVWDAATGEELRTLAGHTGPVMTVAWSPDGTRLASGAWDTTVRVWDAATGEELRTLAGHTDEVMTVAWSPDGTRLASGAGDSTVRMWDAATGEELRTLAGHTGPVMTVAWSPDGTRLASGAADNTVRVWDAATGEELRTLAGHTEAVTSVAWSPDGTRLAGGAYDNTVRVWDAATGEELRTLAGHTGPVMTVAWSPDGTRLASGAYDNTVRVWDAATGEELRTLAGHTKAVTSVAWSPDGTRLASGAYDSPVRVWDAATGEELRTLAGHTNPVMTVAWSPDGTSLASGAYDNTVRVWDAATGEELRTLAGHTEAVTSVAWSPDGTRLAGGAYDNTVRVWDAATGEELRTLAGHTGPVMTVAWSPDGTRLASGAADNTVRVWDAATGEELRTLAGHTKAVTSVAWSPDGTRLASGAYDSPVRVWDAATGEELRTLAGHTNPVMTVAWSPDGTSLASGAEDGTVRVCDAATGEGGLCVVAGSIVRAVAWSKTGAFAIGADQSVIVYSLWV